ncbi:MAG: hypothetical protein WB511_11725 [Nitrososphaeraceae archaeon]
MAVTFTDKRVIVIELEKYNKWIKNNGGILRNEMLDELSQTIYRWSWDFQIYRNDIAKIKKDPKEEYFFYLSPPN